ncbi:MAG: hypothetical protein JXR94_13575 [Candidatus Hydrogenedentes bacterium]|nr:hypothetical protein [Candidatus Hydrogenedentota bacterium]
MNKAARERRVPLWIAPVLIAFVAASCGGPPDTGEDAHVTTMGTAEVTAELVDLGGELIDRPMYDYAHVMKYRILKVHRGEFDGDTLYVAHYNPVKARADVADARVPEIGGSLKSFCVGDIHRMALEAPMDDFYMGGIINGFFDEWKGTIYWAVWTNRSGRP